MGMALWLRDAQEAATAVKAPAIGPLARRGYRFRIEVCGEGRAPWRATSSEAMQDAIDLKLASWDESMGQWYIAVPVDLRAEKPEPGA